MSDEHRTHDLTRPDGDLRDEAADEARRDFLRGLGKWSWAVIGTAIGAGLVTSRRTEAGVWINNRGSWVDAWANGGSVWANRGGSWGNRRGGGSWVNRRGGGGWANRRR
jgi:hypothetical protein